MPQLIFALDVANRVEAMELARKLAADVDWIKIGLELFVACGPQIIPPLRDMGYRIFLDLKLYDIPNTVAGAVRAACGLDVQMLTLHCQGGRRMCEAARQASRESANPPLLFGVTVLTSFAAGEMPGTSAPPDALAPEFAADAAAWGLNGVVCSPMDAATVRARSPSLLILCPGIRLTGTADDQRRVMSPAGAAAAGADFIVVGRPIRTAADPARMARQIREELAESAGDVS